MKRNYSVAKHWWCPRSQKELLIPILFLGFLAQEQVRSPHLRETQCCSSPPLAAGSLVGPEGYGTSRDFTGFWSGPQAAFKLSCPNYTRPGNPTELKRLPTTRKEKAGILAEWRKTQRDRQTDRLGQGRGDRESVGEKERKGKKEIRKEGKREREILFPVRLSSNNLIYGAILENVLFIFMKGLIDAAASFNKLL